MSDNMIALDTAVTVTFPAFRWIGFLGYLSGVGAGDELEMYHWIAAQVNHQVNRTKQRAADEDHPWTPVEP